MGVKSYPANQVYGLGSNVQFLGPPVQAPAEQIDLKTILMWAAIILVGYWLFYSVMEDVKHHA